MELDKNINISIITSVKSKDYKRHTISNNTLLNNKIFNLNIPYNILKRALYLPFIFIYCFLKSPSKTILSFSINKYYTSALNLKNLFYLKYFFNKYFDIIHCHFGQNGLIGTFLKDCGFCKKLIVTFHGTDITTIPRKYSKNIYEYMFSRTDHITAGSEFIKNKLIEHKVKNVTILPMGIKKIPYNERIIGNSFLSIGRLVESKGISIAIEAFKIVFMSYPNIKYNIIGNGPLYKKFQLQIKRLGLTDNVFLLGEKQDDELEIYFHEAIALIFPSIRLSNGSEEGQGLVIQEAAIHGIPVIGTNTGGIIEGIKNGITGWIVPEKNPFSIAEKMKYFIENPDANNEFGKNAYSFALEKYNNKELTTSLISNLYF